MEHHDIIIIGAGLAGLACAIELQAKGLSPLILEASDGVGGRVRTDEHEGFLLDRGFQVLLTAYPEAQRLLNYEALELRSFYPGAKVRVEGHFETLADPFRRPLDGLRTLGARSSSTLLDKLYIAKLRVEQLGLSHEQLYNETPDVSARSWLKSKGFGERIIDGFFRPFYGGVTLDRDLQSSSKMLAMTYKYFAQGQTAIPKLGIGQLPLQLAAKLPPSSIRLNSRVQHLERDKQGATLTLDTGAQLRAKSLVLATDNAWANTLEPSIEALPWRHVTCVYYSAPKPPVEEPILLLNGESNGPVNNLFVPSQLSEACAPDGQSLISASVLEPINPDDDTLDARIRAQLRGWFGDQVERWKHLKTYHIPHAQPDQSPGRLTPTQRPVQLDDHLFVCGDHREMASIDSSLRSGTRAARALMEQRP